VSPCTPLVHLPAGEGPGPPDVGEEPDAAALAGAADTAAAGCPAGDDEKGFGLPLCQAVVRDPAGSFTLTTAERGGRAALAAALELKV
jgi:hypothetical protein